jgi:uncharacterized protein (TIRG00374 family)
MFWHVKSGFDGGVHGDRFYAILGRLYGKKEVVPTLSTRHVVAKRQRALSWAINLAGLLILILILYLGGTAAWQQILRGDLAYVVATLAVTILWNMLAAYRWSLLARQVVGQRICAYRYFLTYQAIGMLIGQVVPITVGMLGGRPVALSLSQQVSLRRSALSVLIDKLFDLALALLLALPVALYLIGLIDLGVALGGISGLVLAGAALIGWKYEEAIRLASAAGAHVVQHLGRFPLVGHRLIRRLPQQLDRLAGEVWVSNPMALQAFLVTVAMYALLAARMILLAAALRLEIPWQYLGMGVSVAQLAIVFSITPGSLGFLEGGWAAVLGLAGLTLDQITTFLIGRRAYVLVFSLMGTLLAFAWIRESPARLFRAVIVASRHRGTGLERGTGLDPARGGDAPADRTT